MLNVDLPTDVLFVHIQEIFNSSSGCDNGRFAGIWLDRDVAVKRQLALYGIVSKAV